MKKLLALVIAGVAVKYFLDSEQGKQLQSQVKNWLGEAQDALGETFNSAKGRAQQAADNMG